MGRGFNTLESGNFFWGHLAQPFDNAEGWMGAYWVRTDLGLPWNQSWISTFTQCCCSRAFMSSPKSSLRPPPNPHLASTHWIVVFWPYKWLNSPTLAETKRLQVAICNCIGGTKLIDCTMPKLQWEVGNRNFSFLREQYIWNIGTRIKWEAKLKNLSEIFGRCQNKKQNWHVDQGRNEQTLMFFYWKI